MIVEVWGWDECFVGARTDDPEALAQQLRAAVLERTQLSCSIGIGDNKLRAKLASAFAKPAGVFRLTADNWVEVMNDRPTDALWGIGKKRARQLSELGIGTVAELARADEDLLGEAFGPGTGPWLKQVARGEHFGRVSAEPHVARSRGKEVTFQQDVSDPEQIRTEIARLARAVAEDITNEGRVARAVSVKIRFAPFATYTRSMVLDAPTTDPDALARGAQRVLDRFDLDRPVRLLGVRADLMPA